MNKNLFPIVVVMSGLAMVAWQGQAAADIKTKVARETADYVVKKFGKEAVKEGAEALAERLEGLVAKHGEEVLQAAKASGPAGVRALEGLTGEAGPAVKVLRTYGPKGIEVVKRPKLLRLVTQYGDDAAEALVRHPGAAEEVIEAFGKPAASAIKGLDGQNARRLAVMVDDGSLAKIAQKDDLLGIIGKYGDRAMDFVWRHKGPFVLGTVAASFWSNPEPYINGTVELSKELLAKTVPGLAKPFVEEGAKHFPWTAFYTVSGVIVLLVAAFIFRSSQWRLLHFFLRRRAANPKQFRLAQDRAKGVTERNPRDQPVHYPVDNAEPRGPDQPSKP